MSFHKFTDLFDVTPPSATEPHGSESRLSRPTTSNDWASHPWLEEFVASAIDPDLALANVAYYEGSQAVETFLEDVLVERQRVQSYLTAGNARLMQRYEFLEAGAWFATCTDSPYCKPSTPRPNPEKPGQTIKYETAPGMPASPLLPHLTVGALRRICAVQDLEFSDVWRAICQKDLESPNPRVATLMASYGAGIGAGLLLSTPSASFSSADTWPPSRPNCQTCDAISPGLALNSSVSKASLSLKSPVPTLPSGLEIPNDLFWPVWQSLDGAVAITEGLKKALALITLGIPTIGLRGVTQWRAAKGSLDLHPDLEGLAKSARHTYIAFDQDEKTKTVAAVSTQAERLGAAIEAMGGAARFMQWDGRQGKGIDDALASLPSDQRGVWLAQVMQRAETLKEWRRRATKARARAILTQQPPIAQQDTTGEYLPPLPALTRGAIHWVDANMGSGKTYRMGRDWVRPWAQSGGIVVVLSPLNSLGQQTAQDWGLPHIHDYGTSGVERQALEADISVNGGMVACVNSAHRVRDLIPSHRPLLLVIDEAAQTLTDAVQGGTLKRNWAARWEDLIALMQQAAEGGAIALAEDGLDQATINLVQTLSGTTVPTIGIRHTRSSTPWPVTLNQATPLSEWRGQLLERLRTGERILYVATSQREGKRLERAAHNDGIVVHRIDSETNEGGAYRQFFETPETWLYQTLPQLVILSPSGKTGLSIEGGISAKGAYFDSVWGYFPALDTDTAMQLLGRYRPPVPRHIWAPVYIQPDPNEKPSPLAITHELETEAVRYAKAGGFGQAPADPHDAAIKRYLAVRGQRRWAQKVQAADALAARLEAAGHQVEVMCEGVQNKAMQTLWDTIKETLAREEAAYHAGLDIDPATHTLDWAHQVKRATDSSREARCKAAKVLMLSRFPGLDWNCPDLWYQAEFDPNHRLAPGVALWAEATHYRELWESDAKEAERILSQRLRAAHLLPQAGPRAMLAAVFSPLVEKLLAVGEVVPNGAEEQTIKTLALRYRSELRRYWRLSITEEQSTTAIANKIARKFGLVLDRTRQVRVAGTKLWVYAITATAIWRALVAAREFALKQTGTNVLELLSNTFVPSLSHHPDPDHTVGSDNPPQPPISAAA